MLGNGGWQVKSAPVSFAGRNEKILDVLSKLWSAARTSKVEGGDESHSKTVEVERR